MQFIVSSCKDLGTNEDEEQQKKKKLLLVLVTVVIIAALSVGVYDLW
jgi:flagellar basal body-associated protein FliL